MPKWSPSPIGVLNHSLESHDTVTEVLLKITQHVLTIDRTALSAGQLWAPESRGCFLQITAVRQGGPGAERRTCTPITRESVSPEFLTKPASVHTSGHSDSVLKKQHQEITGARRHRNQKIPVWDVKLLCHYFNFLLISFLSSTFSSNKSRHGWSCSFLLEVSQETFMWHFCPQIRGEQDWGNVAPSCGERLEVRADFWCTCKSSKGMYIYKLLWQGDSIS